MPLQLYNTLTRTKQDFVPIDPGHVRMYVCGPTVYDYAHIGNARPVVVFDVLYRVLKRLYPRVTYVRNITDVDDKIIEASRRTGEPIERITARTAQAYAEDMAALGALEPDVQPRATHHIAQMVAMIERLIDRGCAYVAADHVLFHVPSDPEYGVLSGRNREELIAGARVEVAPYKHDPADFVLWKPARPDEPGWDSPWGRGRPGWHIECSAMSAEHLGVTFDIHGGGLDLIFPHHENEIAQSTCAHGTPIMARYWVHNGYVMVNGEKMSKSLGNFFTVRELLEEYPGWGEAIRLALLSTQYRQPLDFTREGLAEAKRRLDRFYTALRQSAPAAAGAEMPAGSGEPDAAVQAALEDDLNTPLALTELNARLGLLNDLLHRHAAPAEIAAARAGLVAGGELFGLLQADPEAWFKGEPTGPAALSEAEIEELICRRAAARKQRNFAEADRIRKDLAERGVLLEDGPLGTIWKRAG